MRLPHGEREQDEIGRSRFAVILSRPENHENIGLVARAMKNTGFTDLRLVGVDALRPGAYRTAVHSEAILKKARYFPDLAAATGSLHLVFAATARVRSTFAVLTFSEAVETIRTHPPRPRIGLLFGNERTGLMSEELGAANHVFTLPQASRQPSYNLASAVLLTLFALFTLPGTAAAEPEALPATRTAAGGVHPGGPDEARAERLHPRRERGPRLRDGPRSFRAHGSDGQGQEVPDGRL